ncbi:MAG TPA: PrsW family intramembrane metalloprotease [Marmoricola sp.]
MHRRSNSATFTVLVSLALLVGALAMGAVLLLSGAPFALVVGIVLAAIPVVPLVSCYLWLDRYEPEPRSLLVLGLGWGACTATALALALQLFDSFAFSEAGRAVVVAPLTEEAAKGLFIVLLWAFRRQEFDGILDGIVYAGMVGIGFAFTENILYLASAYMGADGSTGGLESAVGLFIVRCLFSPFAHPLFTAFTGIGIGIAVMSRNRAVRVLAPVGGYALAVTAHGLWNASMMLRGGDGAIGTYLVLMIPSFLVVAAFALWTRAREGKVLAVALADCAGRGYVDASEIPWLVRLPARRACRRFAAEAGGPSARRAMADYQREAIELAYLHHRYLRGAPPPGFEALGQQHIDAMRTLRPLLRWPPARRTAPVTVASGGQA